MLEMAPSFEVEVADVFLLTCRFVLFILLLPTFVVNCGHHLEAVAWSHGMKAIFFESVFQIVLRQVIDQCWDLDMLMCLDCNIRIFSTLFGYF